MPSVQRRPSYGTLLQTSYPDPFAMTDTQRWHSLYDLLDPERTRTCIFQQVSCRATFTRFAPFSAKCLRRQGFSSHSAPALKFSNYQDKMVIDFLSYGWPINYTVPTRPVLSLHNHPSASQFASHVQDYIDTELSWHAIAGPFVYPPPPLFG